MTDLSAVESIYFAALERKSPEDRAAYLDRACGPDPDVRRQVERLLAAEPRVGDFLQPAPADVTLPEGPDDEWSGTVVGPYRLMEQIGEGGMGLVFVAEQQQPVRRRVALKLIKPGMDLKSVVARFEELLRTKVDAVRTRIHGDYHLGQVLWTGRDFVIIDFEGEPTVPLGQRRIKRSPFRDVAGMLRSFHYAAHTALAQDAPAMSPTGEPGPLEPWAEFWYRWVSAMYLGSYLHTAGDAPFVPGEPRQLEVVLDAELLNKAVYELRYEANMRPDWIRIPARGILDLLQDPD